MKKTVISILLGIIAFPAFSQEILTLEKCKELALKNNAQAKNAELSVEAAGQQKKEALTKYFPSVSGAAMGLVFDKPLMTTEVATGYPAPHDKVQVDIIKNTLVGGFMAMQPIFAGGQIINGNRLAKAGVEAGKLQKQMTENEVLLATERYFWQIVSLKEKMKTIEDSETMLNRILSDVKVAVEAGLTTRNDLLRVELEQNRLASGKLKAENGLKILKMALAQHIGMSSDAFDIDVPNLLSLENLTDSQDLTGLENEVKNRPEYKLLETSVDVARLQRDMEIGKHLPTIAIGASYNWVKMDLDKQTEQNKNVGLAFAVVSVPITDWWGGAHAVKRKKLELQQAENTKNEKTDLLLLQMQQITNERNEAYQQILLAKKSISSAEQNLKISRDNFNAGVMTLSDLLEAQNLLQQSQDQYTEAATAYFVKLAEYEQVMNTAH
ncbi:MAG: TolC family protein [Prevotellaceae bacterium]|nr:TolC family protein [Prevotellaceae bacterium]